MLTDALFQALFNISSPRVLLSVHGRDFKIINDNEAFRTASLNETFSIGGKSIRDLFTAGNCSSENLVLLENTLIQSVELKQTLSLDDFEYQFAVTGQVRTRWKLEIMPIANESGQPPYIMLTLEPQKKQKYTGIQQHPELLNIVSHIPIGLCILSGEEMVLEIVNEKMLNLWDRNDSVKGLPLLEFMPELTDQVFPKLLQQVYTSGIAFSNKGAAVQLVVGGLLKMSTWIFLIHH